MDSLQVDYLFIVALWISIRGCSAQPPNWKDSLSHGDEVLMVRSLVSMVTHWTRLMVTHDVRLSSCQDFTKLLCCIISQP